LRRWATVLTLAAAATALFLWLSRPLPLAPRALSAHVPDPANGETIYRVGSCHGCHYAAPDAPGGDAPVGSAPFQTPVGTFYPGNLTPDRETGLGGWTESQFLHAMVDGLAPDGSHYFPAFPYPTFRAVRVDDLLDLWAYLRTLEPVVSPPREPEIPLLAAARRGVGLWKRFLPAPPPLPRDPGRSPAWNRGAYLVHGPGHCGECHTPRDALMRLRTDRALRGGPHPAGEGEVPSLRGLAARGRYRDVGDLALALQYGEELGYDKLSSGGMGRIQVELGRLPETELRAIAEYLMSLE